jgi:hypothetical protein
MKLGTSPRGYQSGQTGPIAVASRGIGRRDSRGGSEVEVFGVRRRPAGPVVGALESDRAVSR